jgi:hypothetical protein
MDSCTWPRLLRSDGGLGNFHAGGPGGVHEGRGGGQRGPGAAGAGRVAAGQRGSGAVAAAAHGVAVGDRRGGDERDPAGAGDGRPGVQREFPLVSGRRWLSPSVRPRLRAPLSPRRTDSDNSAGSGRAAAAGAGAGDRVVPVLAGPGGHQLFAAGRVSWPFDAGALDAGRGGGRATQFLPVGGRWRWCRCGVPR